MYPNRGTFVLNRLKSIQRYAEVTVINPILWFPFCSSLKRYKDYDRIPWKETIEGVEVYHPRFFSIPVILKFLISFTYCLAVLPIALKLWRSKPFDVIDLHWTYPDLPAGRFLAWLFKRKQLVTVRGTPALHLNDRSLPKVIVRRLLAKSDQVITLSDELKDLCIDCGVSSERVITVRNGVDGERFFYREQEICRKELGLPLDAKIVLGAGYLTPRKGFDRIINSFPELLEKCPKARLYIIGQSGEFAQGDRTQKLKKLINQLGIVDRVSFVGEVPNQDLVQWYNSADCFCLSSRSEGCPNVLLEALACGCPVVATDVGAVAEVVAEESMGIVVPNSTDGVRMGLKSVLIKSYDRESISSEIRLYNWDWCARQVIGIYKKLLVSAKTAESETKNEVPNQKLMKVSENSKLIE